MAFFRNYGRRCGPAQGGEQARMLNKCLFQPSDIFKSEQEEQSNSQADAAKPDHGRGDADEVGEQANHSRKKWYESLLVMPDAGHPPP